MNLKNWVKIVILGFVVVFVSILMRILKFFESTDIKKAGIHPRLHLYGTFNLWRKYCQVGWREAKELKSFEILAIVCRHVRIIDDFVDDQLRPNGIFVKNKNLKEASRPLITLLKDKIENLPVSIQIKVKIVKAFQDYRRKVSDALVLEGKYGHDVDLETVLEQRQQVTGTVYSTLIKLLNLIHEVEAAKAKKIENIFALWGLSLQLSDDILDYSDDENSIQNAVVSIVKEYPFEMSIWRVKKRVTAIWAKRNTPLIFQKINLTLEKYLDEMLKIDHYHPIVKIMAIISRGIFRATLSYFPKLQ
ncbi:MAG: class 1 isoprenoid biosynthesis enzyme [Candidatus Kuenenbacteria bacterium]